MAKPRIFISSTYYDLKQTREDLAQFILSLGYEPIRNEEGNIPYGQHEQLENYCYKEIQNVDILVSIIGGRYGSESSHSSWSISNEELRTALKENKQVYIFIDKNVLSEYETYLCNKDVPGIKYRYVDNTKVYQFIEEIKKLSNNNNIKAFETSAEIQQYLKEQLAGLFQSFLSNLSKMKDYDLSSRLENATRTLEHLADFIKETNKGNEEGIAKLLRMNHPFIKQLSMTLNLKFEVSIDNISGLRDLLSSMAWAEQNQNNSNNEGLLVWEKYISELEHQQLIISNYIFESSGELKNIKVSNWDNSWLRLEVLKNDSFITSDDLPF